jgi:hypothetical protein
MLAVDASAAVAEVLLDFVEQAVDLDLHLGELLAEVQDDLDAGEVDAQVAVRVRMVSRRWIARLVVEAGVAGAACQLTCKSSPSRTLKKW